MKENTLDSPAPAVSHALLQKVRPESRDCLRVDHCSGPTAQNSALHIAGAHQLDIHAYKHSQLLRASCS